MELTTAIQEYGLVRPLLAAEGVTRLAELRLRQGKLDEAAELFSRVEHEGIAQAGRAEFALALGDARQALDIIDRHLRRIPVTDRVERAPFLDVLARAALESANLARTTDAAAELRTIAAAVATVPLRAVAARIDGLLAHQSEDFEGARQSLEDAVDLFARAEAPYETARTRVALGQVLAAAGQHEAATREWSRALEAFRSLGAGLDAARVMDLLGPPDAPVTRQPSTALGLSERETEILRMVAGGLSNQYIAAALVLSVRTVERHLSNIYDKLGVSGRSARAAITARAFASGLLPAPENQRYV